MPRFGIEPHKAPPSMPEDPQLEITVEGKPLAVLCAADLEALGPREYRADFHCVTTWSVTGLTWTGVPVHQALASVGITEPPAAHLRTIAGDNRRGWMVWEDAVAPDVLLATHLNGEPLGGRHGGPLRLVAPQQYGYKSMKHLVSIDFRAEEPRRLGKEHLRGRVTLQERHPRFPTWLVRLPSRLLIPPTAHIAQRALARSQDAAVRSREI